MSNQIKKQSNTDPRYRNLTRGKTTNEKLEIIGRNSFDIDNLCTLIEGFDTTCANESIEYIEHATGLIQRLAREITINYAGAVDNIRAGGSHE